MVEPIFGVLGAFAVSVARPVLPYALSFAAGAMIYVVLDDIIPEANTRQIINAEVSVADGFTGFASRSRYVRNYLSLKMIANPAKILPWDIDIDVLLDEWKLLWLEKDDSSEQPSRIDVYYQRFFDLRNPSGQWPELSKYCRRCPTEMQM
ncbi:hypothetical protein FQA39_LY07582 [Lamprigera yunnana]|nr:hypothetical protein FQA39_LY07582 [Lamprigera yunnana]